MSVADPPVASPCIRNCTLDDRDICLGCGRTLAEIGAWGRASDPRRRTILRDAQARRADMSRRPMGLSAARDRA